MDQVEWERTDSPTAADAAAIDEGLEAANRAVADLSAVRPLACFARWRSGELVGGAVARTWGRCCELRQLWVAEPHRRRGVGRRLVQLVEEEARARGCAMLFLETFNFQAPELYLSLGFEVACEFGGFPGGIAKYIMRKALAEPRPDAAGGRGSA